MATVFCKLPPGQLAALLFLESIMASPAGTSKAMDGLKKALADKNWGGIQFAATLLSDTPPTVADFQTVGTMSTGLQNAYFFLSLVDVQATDDAKQQMADALATCCWDQVAQQIISSIATTGLTFSGDDLHQAYDPTNTGSCKGPTDFEKAIGEIIKDGKLVGNFFSSTLPDFFKNDFANFFTGTLAGFFTGDFVNFFKDFGDIMKNGFEDLGNTLKNAFQDLGGKLDPTKW